MSKYFSVYFFFFSMILGYAGIRSHVRTDIYGVVLNKETNSPVQKAYVYTVKGEDEAVTDSRGAFHIVAWSAAPFTIYTSHKDFKDHKAGGCMAGQHIKILLEKK